MLLGKDIILVIYERHIQMQATELQLAINSFSPPNMNEIFEIRNEYPSNLRQKLIQYTG